MDTPKYQYFQGKKFTRDDKTGYYLNSTMRKRMHTYVWEYFNGSVPKGYHIHHIDGNKANNDISNLAVIEKKNHWKLHGEMLTEADRQKRRDNLALNACPKAAEWHKSDAGREWHKQHYKDVSEAIFNATSEKPCLNCGKIFSAHHTSKFCSNACKSAYRRKCGADEVIRECVICGKPFSTNKYKHILTCSRKCTGALVKRRRYNESQIGEETC